MSTDIYVPTGLQLICNLEKGNCCSRCRWGIASVTKLLRFNLFCETRWQVTFDKFGIHVKLLESDFAYLRIYCQVEGEEKSKFEMDLCEYSNLYVGNSRDYKYSAGKNCFSDGYTRHIMSENDFPFKLVINVDHNYVNYKRIKTQQSQNSKLSQQFKILLENADMSDVLLVVRNQEFPVHKTVLAARSPVFYAMFNNDMKEKKENRVKIDDVDPEVMKQLLLYVYTGDIDVDSADDEQAVNLLKAADKYALEELKFICAKIISKNLTIDNVFAMIGMAEHYKLNYLKKDAAYFIVRNFNDILQSPDDLDVAKPISYEEENDTET